MQTRARQKKFGKHLHLATDKHYTNALASGAYMSCNFVVWVMDSMWQSTVVEQSGLILQIQLRREWTFIQL